MTAPARITQADIDRALKSIGNAGVKQARIVMDLARERIEIIIGEQAPDSPADTWDDDDV